MWGVHGVLRQALARRSAVLGPKARERLVTTHTDTQVWADKDSFRRGERQVQRYCISLVFISTSPIGFEINVSTAGTWF